MNELIQLTYTQVILYGIAWAVLGRIIMASIVSVWPFPKQHRLETTTPDISGPPAPNTLYSFVHPSPVSTPLQHHGRIKPVHAKNIEELKLELAICVKEERYYMAAVIRDIITEKQTGYKE